MANPNKVRGDNEERAVEKIVQGQFPDARRTRPGRREDAGDIISPEGKFTLQAKAVKTPQWSQWLDELGDQKANSGMPIAFLSVKRSRPGKPPLRLAVMSLDEMLSLIERAK